MCRKKIKENYIKKNWHKISHHWFLLCQQDVSDVTLACHLYRTHKCQIYMLDLSFRKY